MASESMVQLNASCLCKQHQFTTAVSHAALPLQGICCHCDSCRHLSSGMYTVGVVWPGSTQEVLDSSLQSYQISSRLTAFFCGTCSSPMFVASHRGTSSPTPTDSLHIAVGALENIAGHDVVNIAHHLFVNDTLDGGASVFMSHPNSNSEAGAVPRWTESLFKSEQQSPEWPSADDLKRTMQNARQDNIPFHCHCKGVQFLLRHPVSSFQNTAKDDLPAFVDPTSKRLVVSYDACDSCRISTGTHVMYWTFALLQHIEFATSGPESFPRSTLDLKAAVGKSVDEGRDPRFGTLAFYESSDDVQRYFCSRCSATIFYAVDDLSEQVDIAVGLLDAPEGARAESLLIWGFDSMGHFGDVRGGWRESMYQAVKDNSEQWRISRGIPKTWLRIAREQAQVSKSL